MRKLSVMLAVTLGVVLGVSALAFAQGTPMARQGRMAGAGERMHCGGQRFGGPHGEMAKLKLTEAQQAQARTIREQARKDSQAVITPEQRAQMQQAREQRFTALMHKLGLSAEQQAKATALKDSTKAQMQQVREDATLTPQARRTKTRDIMHNALQQGKQLLTPAQQQQAREVFTQMRGARRGPAITLTDAQKAQMQAIRTKAHAQFRQLLTPEQQQQLDQCHKAQPAQPPAK